MIPTYITIIKVAIITVVLTVTLALTKHLTKDMETFDDVSHANRRTHHYVDNYYVNTPKFRRFLVHIETNFCCQILQLPSTLGIAHSDRLTTGRVRSGTFFGCQTNRTRIGHRVVSEHSRPLPCPRPFPQHSSCQCVFATATQTASFTADARNLTAVSPAECCFSRCPVRYLYPATTKRRDVREMCRPAMTTIN